MSCVQNQFIAIGKFCKPFGIRGDIRIAPYSDQHVNFSRVKDIVIGDTKEKYTVVQWTLQKPLRCKLQGIDTPEDARLLMGKNIYIPREFAVPLNEGEHYVADLEHLKVLYNDAVVGHIKSVIAHAYTPLLEIELHNTTRTVYIPFIKEFFAAPDFQSMSIELYQAELIEE